MSNPREEFRRRLAALRPVPVDLPADPWCELKAAFRRYWRARSVPVDIDPVPERDVDPDARP